MDEVAVLSRKPSIKFNDSERGQDRTKLAIDHKQEVAYSLSFGTEIERPWMTLKGH